MPPIQFSACKEVAVIKELFMLCVNPICISSIASELQGKVSKCSFRFQKCIDPQYRRHFWWLRFWFRIIQFLFVRHANLFSASSSVVTEQRRIVNWISVLLKVCFSNDIYAGVFVCVILIGSLSSKFCQVLTLLTRIKIA